METLFLTTEETGLRDVLQNKVNDTLARYPPDQPHLTPINFYL
jgi:hypothetical protein